LIDLLIIGAQRAGTTSLYNYITQHPNVAKASSKEIHFFDNNYDKGIDWYLNHFPLSTINSDMVTGEATPYYIFHPLARKRIQETIPEVKLIVLLRNPVDRAFSHYNHTRRQGNETLTFEEAIRLELLTLPVEKKKVQQGNYSAIHQKLSYLERGIYVDQLKKWFDVFPKKQFLILKSEDFFSNPLKILNEIFQFLNIPKLELKDFEKLQSFEYQKMTHETREKLEEFFKPLNEKLYMLLNKDFDW